MRSCKGHGRSCLTLKRFRSKAFFSVPVGSVWRLFCNVEVKRHEIERKSKIKRKDNLKGFNFKNRISLQFVILAVCVLIVAYLALIPLGMLIFNSIRSAPLGTKEAFFTLKNYLEAYLDPEFFPLLKNSFIFGFGSCLLTFCTGATLAWLYERTNTPLKTFFGIMALIPFIIPGILSTIAWICF